MTSFKYMGLGHTRCRVSAESGDSVKVVQGEVIEVQLGSHPELTEGYFLRGGFVKVEVEGGSTQEPSEPSAPETTAPEAPAETETAPLAPETTSENQ